MDSIRTALLALLVWSAALGQDRPSVESAPRSVETGVAVEELMGWVGWLADDARKGRGAGSAEETAIVGWIAQQFEELGLRPAEKDQTFKQAFTMRAATRHEGSLRIRQFASSNVVGWLRGNDPELSSEYILIGAHWDHLGVQGGEIYNGADDNASGVAGLLGIAKVLATSPVKLRRSVLFVAFGGEEHGLLGSRHYVKEPLAPLSQLVTMINLDMIGRKEFLGSPKYVVQKKIARIPDGPGLGVIGGEYSKDLLEIARTACRAVGIPSRAPQDSPLFKNFIRKQVAGRADHYPFELEGIPHLFFSTSEHGDYHQPTDDVELVDGETIRRVVSVVCRVTRAVDRLDKRPEFVRPAAPAPKDATPKIEVPGKAGR